MHHANNISQEHPHRTNTYQGVPSNNVNIALEDKDMVEMIDRFCGKDFGAKTVDNMDSRIEDDDLAMWKL